MQLPLLFLVLGPELFQELVILEDQPLLLPGVFLKALPLTLIELVQTFRLGSTLISLILRRGQLVFKVFNCLAHVSLPRLHLALIDLRLLRSFLFLHGLSFVDLSDELLFLQGQLLSFELDDLELLLVLATQLCEL